MKITFLWNICFLMSLSACASDSDSGNMINVTYYDITIFSSTENITDTNEPNEPNEIPPSLMWAQPPIEIAPDVNVPPILWMG